MRSHEPSSSVIHQNYPPNLYGIRQIFECIEISETIKAEVYRLYEGQAADRTQETSASGQLRDLFVPGSWGYPVLQPEVSDEPATRSGGSRERELREQCE